MKQTWNFNLRGQERKSLVSAISELLNAKTEYLGAPGFQYHVGDYEIDKEGAVTGEYNLNLMTGLAERGFEPEPDKTFHLITPRGTLLIQEHFDTAAEAEAAGYGIYFHHEGRDVFVKASGKGEHSKHFALVGEPFPEAGPEEPVYPEVASDKVCLEVALEGFTPESLDNLCKMVLTKEPLLKKALNVDALPIKVTEDRIRFDWFPAADSDSLNAYSQFLTCLCAKAKEKKRVTAKPQESFENEKFAMRVWLIGLGLVGKNPEYALARKLMMANLSGDAAWRYGKPEKKAPQEEIPAPEGEEAVIPAAEDEVPTE
ncbi:MAG: hypothetical protein FWF85_04535 [Clostridiales bacterium]|nr:hypothetical protein [Clostridiales bacterium]